MVRKTMYDADAFYDILIGEQLENNSRSIQIDCTSWMTKWPNGVITLLIERPRESESYLASGVSVRNGVLTWVPDRTDLEIAGNGHIQVRLQSGGSVVKLSKRWNVTIPASLEPPNPASPGTTPGWVTDLLEEIQDGVADAQDAMRRAQTSASNAATSASNASTSASNAATSATNANTSATAAQSSATAAQTSATAASNAATTAEGHANTADQKQQLASGYADDAEASADDAAASAAEAADYLAQLEFVPLTEQQIIDIFQEEQGIIVSAKENAFVYRGAVSTKANLPTAGMDIGDIYDVEDTGTNYAWNGTAWDDLAGMPESASDSEINGIFES